MTQGEAVVCALEKLGGVGTLGQLYQEIDNIKECRWGTKTRAASIRRIVQTNGEIYKIKPGLYALKKLQEKHKKDEIISNPFNHTYYQGLLVTIGNLKSLETFIPAQDKNKIFINSPLGELSTLKHLPTFSYPNIIKRSSSVDVIWLNERVACSTRFLKWSTQLICKIRYLSLMICVIFMHEWL